jgi:hypothetical protein
MRQLFSAILCVLSFVSFSQNDIQKFELTPKGVDLIKLKMDSLSAEDLYNRTMLWVGATFQDPAQALQRNFANEFIAVRGFKERAWHYKPLGIQTSIDMGYTFEIHITDRQLLLQFIPGEFLQTDNGKSTDQKDGNATAPGLIPAPPARTYLTQVKRVDFTTANFFNANGDVKPAFQEGKIEFEASMNELAASLYDYVKSQDSPTETNGLLLPMSVTAEVPYNHYAAMEVELFKIGSRRTVTIRQGRNVWIRCANKKGKIKVRKAKLVAITEHDMTFKPFNKNFNVVTYPDYALDYIGYTSTGRVTIAFVTNVIIIAAVTVVYVVLSLMSPSNPGSGPGKLKILLPLRKNIDLHGGGKWGLRLVSADNIDH